MCTHICLRRPVTAGDIRLPKCYRPCEAASHLPIDVRNRISPAGRMKRVSEVSVPNPINYKYTINIDVPHSFEISGRPDISDVLAT